MFWKNIHNYSLPKTKNISLILKILPKTNIIYTNQDRDFLDKFHDWFQPETTGGS